jgi:hypothetical protein
MNLMKRLWCRHESTEVRTFLTNFDGPMVRREMKCTDCGKVIPIEMMLPAKRVAELLAQAENLAPNEVVEI